MTQERLLTEGFKQTPIGPIPEDWETKRLEEVCSHFKSGFGITSDNISDFGNYPVFGGNGLRGYTDTYTHNGNFILIGRQGALCGNIQKISNKVYLSEHAIAVQIKENYSLDFLAYKLDFINLNRLSESSAQPDLAVEKLLRLRVGFPPFPEQTAIAECLSPWDEAISKTQALIKQKQLRKKWLMQQLLTGKKRLKGFEGEWKKVRMKDLFERVTRKNAEVNTNVVTISVQQGFVLQTDFFNKSIASDILDNYFLVEKGEFCYNKSYSNGYPWGATKRLKDFDKAVVTTLYISFKIKDLWGNSGDFFEYFFEANSLDRGLTKIAHEGGRAHGLLNVTPGDFFELQIIVPAYNEQLAIAQRLQTADNEIALLKTKLDYLKEQKKGLMQVLLTGKRRLINCFDNYEN
ncbi:MAG: restriction endonuclease subunit S [Bacteroidales bacterium]|nr:restriction endonuclease subunit S [Bacteroidales bacterium]